MICDKPTVNIILKGDSPENFSSRIRKNIKLPPLTLIQHSTGGSYLPGISQQKEINVSKEKEEVKTVCLHLMILCMESPKDPTKSLELISGSVKLQDMKST